MADEIFKYSGNRGFAILLFIGVAILALFTKRKVKEIYINYLAVAYGYDMMTSSFKAGEDTFHFHLFGNFVIGLRGQKARRILFEEKNFSSSDGYKMFSKAVPVPEVTTPKFAPEEEDYTLAFKKHLGTLLAKDRLNDLNVTMFKDIQRVMETWGEEGTMDPFKHINDIAFLSTVHMVTSDEFVSDLSALSQFQKHFSTQLNSHTPGTIFFPWFYRNAQRKREKSIMTLFSTLTEHIEARKEHTVPKSEAIDLLLARGLSTQEIIQFILGFLFGGAFNATKATSWILLYISLYPQWRSAIRSEIESIFSHTSVDASESVHSKLSSIPVDDWEGSMPTLDLVISETLRLVMNQIVLRRNMGESLNVDELGQIPRGAFLVYSNADAHLNPEVYADPWTFNPQRFSQDKDEGTYTFLGWGAGRHRCVGVKIAKLAIKAIVSSFVMTYDYDVASSNGKVTSKTPIPDYNNINDGHPKDGVYFINYRRTG